MTEIQNTFPKCRGKIASFYDIACPVVYMRELGTRSVSLNLKVIFPFSAFVSSLLAAFEGNWHTEKMELLKQWNLGAVRIRKCYFGLCHQNLRVINSQTCTP